MAKPGEYVTLLAYYVVTGLGKDRAHLAQDKAAYDNAPLDAIYFREGKEKWVTLSDLDPSMPIVEKVNALLKSFGSQGGA